MRTIFAAIMRAPCLTVITLTVLILIVPLTTIAQQSNNKAVAETIEKICGSTGNFSQFDDAVDSNTLAPALAQVMKDVTRSNCWAQASGTLRKMRGQTQAALPDLLGIISDTSSEVTGPMRELQQAFAISSLPEVTGANASQTVYTLLNTLLGDNVSPQLKQLITSTLSSQFSHSTTSVMRLLQGGGGGLHGIGTGSGTMSQRDLENAIRDMQRTTQREATKWMQLFKQELQRLNSTSYR